MTSRNYCFTISNPESLPDVQNPAVRYCVFQEEIGENGTPHLQGYIEMSRSMRLTWLKTNLPGFETAHLEPRMGTREQARAYCMKPETRIGEVFESGDWESGGQGTRVDIAALKELVDKGATDEAIWDAMPLMYLKYNRAIKDAKRLKTKCRDWKTEVIVLIGKPRLGKSKYCLDNAPKAYWKQRSQWWDGYEGQEDVVIDDYYAWLPWDTLMRILDRYPLLVETKGGQSNFVAKRVFITSNKAPADWYKDQGKFPLDALTERVTKWVLFTGVGVFQEFDNYFDFSIISYAHTNPILVE